MYGMGMLKGLGVTLRHFVDTYVEDIRWLGHQKDSPETLATRQGPRARGMFTVQYPDVKLPVPEEFRYVPFLVYEEGPDGEQKQRCTSCGICVKVCPAQCIWIVRGSDPATGRPIPDPKEFTIDIDQCMSCGLCAEFCPFDAIKMDHQYELATFDRLHSNMIDIQGLSRPVSYYTSIRPANYAREEAARAQKEAARAARRTAA
jgi:NADH-quinone oxidoreductase subunit I